MGSGFAVGTGVGAGVWGTAGTLVGAGFWVASGTGVETGLVVGAVVGAGLGVADEHAGKIINRRTARGTKRALSFPMDTMARFNCRISQ